MAGTDLPLFADWANSPQFVEWDIRIRIRVLEFWLNKAEARLALAKGDLGKLFIILIFD
jgi:hypothetical protein